MTRAEIKNWAKTKIKGHVLELLVPIMVAGILTNITIGSQVSFEDGVKVNGGYNIGILFFFVQVGLAYFMVKFINDQEHNFKDLFYFTKDYVRTLIVGFLQGLFIFLWALLLIVPGIIKAIAYSLVTMILADEKYADLGYMEVLKKSEEMMNGHKMDFFLLGLSFIGWHFLALFTLGLLEIWLVPYQTTASYKFLDNIKKEYEKQNAPSGSASPAETKEEAKKFCPNCGTQIDQDASFCNSCGTQI